MTLPELCSPNPRYTHTVFCVCLPWLPPQVWSDLLISVKQKREASWTGALVLLLRKVNWSGFTACQHLIFTLGSFWTWIHRQGTDEVQSIDASECEPMCGSGLEKLEPAGVSLSESHTRDFSEPWILYELNSRHHAFISGTNHMNCEGHSVYLLACKEQTLWGHS